MFSRVGIVSPDSRENDGSVFVNLVKQIQLGILKCTILLAVSTWAYGANAAIADEQTNKNYPTIQELYDDCSTALKLAETDEKGFLHSSCARQMTGIYSGILAVLMNFQLTSDKNDPYAKFKDDLGKRLKSFVCMPKNIPRNSPLEVRVVKDFVAYIDKHLRDKNGNIRSDAGRDSPMLAPAGIFVAMYSCKSAKGDK